MESNDHNPGAAVGETAAASVARSERAAVSQAISLAPSLSLPWRPGSGWNDHHALRRFAFVAWLHGCRGWPG